jgi:sulfate adenylyltransferase subunit 1 (EFTu-like GTPase family)
LQVVVWRPTLFIVKCSKFEYVKWKHAQMYLILAHRYSDFERTPQLEVQIWVPVSSIAGERRHVGRRNIYWIHSQKCSEILTKLHEVYQRGDQSIDCLLRWGSFVRGTGTFYNINGVSRSTHGFPGRIFG